MQKHIVRQSYIQGIVGVDFDMLDIYRLTQAFLSWLPTKNTLQKVVVGMDGRNHSADIYQQVSQAIVHAGHQVCFVGVCPVSLFMLGQHHIHSDAGIMITASDSGVEYNGLKLYVKNELVEGAALREIYDIAQKNIAIQSLLQGKITPCPVLDLYLESLWQEFAHLSEYDFTMVLDASSGATGSVLKRLVSKMGWKNVIVVHEQIDGMFSAQVSESFDPLAVKMVQDKIQQQTSFGVIFNGDGDRLLVIDEKGIVISPERLLAMFARSMLERQKNGVIIHDIQDFSWINYVLQAAHGKVIMYQRSHERLSELILQHKPCLIGQEQGKFCFFDRHVGYPDSIYVFLRLLDILVVQRCTIHDLLVSLPKQIMTHHQPNDPMQQYF